MKTLLILLVAFIGAPRGGALVAAEALHFRGRLHSSLNGLPVSSERSFRFRLCAQTDKLCAKPLFEESHCTVRSDEGRVDLWIGLEDPNIFPAALFQKPPYPELEVALSAQGCGGPFRPGGDPIQVEPGTGSSGAFEASAFLTDDDGANRASAAIPAIFAAARVYPNPFNPALSTPLTVDGVPADTRLIIFTLRGEKIHDHQFVAPATKTSWDGTNPSGRTVASGIYLISLKSGTDTRVMKVAVVR